MVDFCFNTGKYLALHNYQAIVTVLSRAIELKLILQ